MSNAPRTAGVSDAARLAHPIFIHSPADDPSRHNVSLCGRGWYVGRSVFSLSLLVLRPVLALSFSWLRTETAGPEPTLHVEIQADPYQPYAGGSLVWTRNSYVRRDRPPAAGRRGIVTPSSNSLATRLSDHPADPDRCSPSVPCVHIDLPAFRSDR